MAKKIIVAVIALLLLYGVYRLVTTSEPMITGTYSCHTETEEYYFAASEEKGIFYIYQNESVFLDADTGSYDMNKGLYESGTCTLKTYGHYLLESETLGQQEITIENGTFSLTISGETYLFEKMSDSPALNGNLHDIYDRTPRCSRLQLIPQNFNLTRKMDETENLRFRGIFINNKES